MRDVIIAVDAGGTKTKVALIDSGGRIVYEKIGGPGSPAVSGKKALYDIFSQVQDVCLENKDSYNFKYVQMGISGLGVIGDKSKFEAEFSDKLGIAVSLENDAIIALFSIVEDKYNEGILVLSGTGSATYGVKDLETKLIGGWGHLLVEEGSSYAVVRRLVVDIINQSEKGLEISPLGKKFMQEINISDVNDFKVFMYGNKKDEIASYAKFISNEATNGDNDAIRLLKDAGRALAFNVIKAYNFLKLGSDAVIGFRGSFIIKAPFVKEELFKTLLESNYHLQEVTGSVDPIYGAYYMAKRKQKI